MTCTVSACRLVPVWALLFPGHDVRIRYCGEHAHPHLRRADVNAERLR